MNSGIFKAASAKNMEHFRVYGAEAASGYQVGKWFACIVGEGARLFGYPGRLCVVDDFGNLVGC